MASSTDEIPLHVHKITLCYTIGDRTEEYEVSFDLDPERRVASIYFDSEESERALELYGSPEKRLIRLSSTEGDSDLGLSKPEPTGKSVESRLDTDLVIHDPWCNWVRILY